MRTRAPQIALATLVVAGLAAAPAAAQTDPYSEAGASAVEVDGVATVSGTTATTQDDGSASATVLGLGGETVVGGAQEGPGENEGEIVTTGEDNEQGHLTVGGWDTTVEEDRSSARSAVVDGNLGGEEGASVTVLESESEAREDGADAETTGVTVDLGGSQLHLELLKATTSSSGEGRSYVLSINDEALLTSEQADGQCEIPADPIVHLLCLYANAIEGADGLTGGNAGVVDAAALDGNLTGRLFHAEAATVPGDPVPSVTPSPFTDVPDPAPDPASGPLPRTGAGLLAGLLGLFAMGAGEGLRRFGRR